MQRPEVLNTRVNDQTGEVFSVTQDPTTGQVTTQKVGSVGVAEQEAERIGMREMADGSLGVVFQTPEGDIVTRKATDEQGNPVLASDTSSGGGGGGNDTGDLESDTFQTPTGDTISLNELATGEGLKRAVNNLGVNPADAEARLEESFESGTVDAIFKSAGISKPTAGEAESTEPVTTSTIRNDILGYMSNKELKNHAEQAGFKTGGFLGVGDSGDDQAYLNNVKTYINGLIKQGMTRKEAIEEWRNQGS